MNLRRECPKSIGALLFESNLLLLFTYFCFGFQLNLHRNDARWEVPILIYCGSNSPTQGAERLWVRKWLCAGCITCFRRQQRKEMSLFPPSRGDHACAIFPRGHRFVPRLLQTRL
ncbi:uncharacterized protein FOBCDRAFT_218883 [Fusarium oxysporum Fo47]|uniref:uncharacterized protein n=1 Tax=Fusarium oxysporum Fo47 TaxID=660027 RepID=UPI0028699289|nr:uncharacterized protein FOBCDRAFT_218883 [Fusarium oxysporum Fo47]WJG35005.1 hypothetical protein FOBCDRAFT_218883 [Fusarium oxysporum Fo47]